VNNLRFTYKDGIPFASETAPFDLTKAEMYGRVTGKAGVCGATLGPGAINLLLGTADAFANSSPLVAIGGRSKFETLSKWLRTG